MNQYDIAILGGDRRIACMAPVFTTHGYRVICYAASDTSSAAEAQSLKEAMDSASVIVCGIPFTKDGNLYCGDPSVNIPLTELQRNLRKHQVIFGGVIPKEFKILCEERGIRCYDFMTDEPLTLFNAVATAEGAILEALSHKETLIHHSKCLVLGFGRCGSLIAQRLRGLCGLVTVAVNDPTQAAKARAAGYDTLPLSDLAREISGFDYVFNTIPACFLDAPVLCHLKSDTLVLDIASGKSGLDYQYAQTLPLNIRYLPGLPGKYASESCAKELVQYVLQNIPIKKKGV